MSHSSKLDTRNLAVDERKHKVYKLSTRQLKTEISISVLQ